MDHRRLHSWRVTPREAAQIQLRLRSKLELTDRLPAVGRVAGADLAFDLDANRAIAGVVVYSFPEMQEVERAWGASQIAFPYVPGLLSFREAPALLKVFSRIKNSPDLIFCDGHGYAHPRRFGITSHLGLLLDTPTIGCAKSLLIGTHGRLPLKAKAWTPLRDGDEVIGAVLRTREGVNPIYVTQGHRVSLPTALKFVLAVLDGYRIPRPTRDADHFVAAVKRGEYSARS
ncbi:MAG TPA: deoxyribonuclease V [Candidatus Acidoferrales bacterium]|nr:deoxyribonuclease V [Candidatus Acidoferrales bacterium]